MNDQLGEVEQELAIDFEDRLMLGQKAYGKFVDTLKTRPRDWFQEMMDERLDDAVYALVALKLMRKRMYDLEVLRDSVSVYLALGGADDKEHMRRALQKVSPVYAG